MIYYSERKQIKIIRTEHTGQGPGEVQAWSLQSPPPGCLRIALTSSGSMHGAWPTRGALWTLVAGVFTLLEVDQVDVADGLHA